MNSERSLSVVVPQTIQEYARCLDIHYRSTDIGLHAMVHGGKHKGRDEETIRQLVESACEMPHDHERRWILADFLEDADDGRAGLGDVARIQRMIGDKLSEFRLMQEACRHSDKYLEFLRVQQDKYGLFLFLGDRPHVMDEYNRQCKRCRLSERRLVAISGGLTGDAPDDLHTRKQCATEVVNAGTYGVPRCCVRKVEPTRDGEPRPVIAFPEISEVPPPPISGVLQPEPLAMREYNIKRFFGREYWGPLLKSGQYATVYKRERDAPELSNMNPHPHHRFLFYVSEFLDWHIMPLGS